MAKKTTTPKAAPPPDPELSEDFGEKEPETEPDKKNLPLAAAEPPLRTRAQAKAEKAAESPSAPARRLYRVWEHGSLQRNGQTHAPGSTVALLPAEAASIPCLTPADE